MVYILYIGKRMYNFIIDCLKYFNLRTVIEYKCVLFYKWILDFIKLKNDIGQ